MKINGIECAFHRMGIPTTEPKPDERFSERFGTYTLAIALARVFSGTVLVRTVYGIPWFELYLTSR